MFEARLLNGVIFRKIIDAVKDLVGEVTWKADNFGLTLQAMDSSHVSLVSILLKSDGFEHFRADRSYSLGTSLISLSKVLKCMELQDILTLKVDNNEDSITLIYESKEEEKFSNFDIKLMQIDSEELGIPNQDYDCVVTIPSNNFQRICRDMNTIGETIVISVDKDGVKFGVVGDIGSGDIKLKHSDYIDNANGTSCVKVEMKGEKITQTFALRYLNMFTKATALSDFVKLSISNENPLIVEYKIDDLGHIRYYLAPKIEEE